ncbi:hypothetical protein CCUS01_14911 [Colletotrichum cuscutae]|uniref:catechol O-methyltransferase n=1 Tax=Colletotrichum cuscutae TaxID=1209917 RepID=A0AAI9Y8B5_9PEZI|nr:hypothetical protein CCUS01_14911 [Colletotrichum cuscutae]
MPHFDESKAYAVQEEVFFDDGREIELLHFVYSQPNLDEIRGSPEGVLQAIDDFGRTKKYLMNVGEDKGKIVTDLIAEVKPKVMASPGGGAQYFSLERNPEFAAVIGSLVDLAGLTDTVKVVVGPSDASIARLHADGTFSKIDLVFLDHYKPAYTTDLKLAEQLGLVGPGSVLAADNVIKPGNPPYLEYVRSSVAEKRAAARDVGDARKAAGWHDERTAKQYEKREGEERLDLSRIGNPNLRYESKLIDSFEPTGVPDGVEITRCVGEEKE